MFDLRERDVDPRQELTESFPDLAPRIGKLLERFRDPMALFRDRSGYLWRGKGSYSMGRHPGGNRDAMILAALTRACGRAGTS